MGCRCAGQGTGALGATTDIIKEPILEVRGRFSVMSQPYHGVDAIIVIPVLGMTKLRHRKVKRLAQAHSVSAEPALKSQEPWCTTTALTFHATLSRRGDASLGAKATALELQARHSCI